MYFNTPIHQQSLRQFTRTNQVYKHEELPSMALKHLKKVPLVLADFAKTISEALLEGEDHALDKEGKKTRIIEIPSDHSDLRMFRFEDYGSMVVLSEDLETFVGGIGTGMTWIEEAYRGNGYGRHMLLAAIEDGNTILAPSFYSESGYGNRKAVHRMACEKAHSAGEELHPENYEPYGLSPLPGVEINAVRAELEEHFADLLLRDVAARQVVAEQQFVSLNALQLIEEARETLDEDTLAGLGIEVPATEPAGP